MTRKKNGIAGTLLFAIVGVLGTLDAAPALAHGPTIQLSDQEMKPALLNLFVGTTVHFSVAKTLPGARVVIDEEAGDAPGDEGPAVESPALEAPGDGWHYRFESEGTYVVYLREFPKARARIVVIRKRGVAGGR